MNKLKIFSRMTFVATVVCLFGTTAAMAQSVDMRLSSREAYVGMPLVLQISIRNADDYEAPSIPKIDGCDVRSAGTPSQSSQITIINGRRSESRSVTMQYLITPRREGSFEIPSMTLSVDGKVQQTQPTRFVATQSETGDLLFVEIEGGTDSVYVGQPLDLKLTIWIKPFVDRENKIQLAEGQMWQMISEQTSWGSFTDRMRELAENNQRPGGREVLRDNGEGKKRSYFRYEIEATVYPTRPGKIDASDVQIVVNYPTALGRSRDPFDDFFKDSPFRGRMGQLMDDDFFASPFGRRLTVKSARPIVAEANVDSTEVLPVPLAGRPADYRGAVGNYEIATRATPNEVKAGDPITLDIGIVGDGPMELVQAPPLSTLERLTSDFKVTDQSLAGFVQDQTKVFSTTIRPRREGITKIPAIPYSFFDPDSESFKTVYSQPIDITVNQSEMLVLDSIVGSKRGKTPDKLATQGDNEPDLTNHASSLTLVSESPSGNAPWLWALVVAPPIAWLMTFVYCNKRLLAAVVPNFRSPRSRCLNKINRATQGDELSAAIVEYIARRAGKPCDRSQTAIGFLRVLGLQSTANQVESFLSKCEQTNSHWQSNESFSDLQRRATAYVDEMDREITNQKQRRVRRRNRPSPKTGRRNASRSHHGPSSGKITSLILVGFFVGFAAPRSALAIDLQDRPESIHSETATPSENTIDQENPQVTSALQLSDAQRETILQEANAIYDQAQQAVQTDSAVASEGFSSAAEKYQLVVDSGVRNSKLFVNLGNAYLQSGELGRSIANYERARLLAPSNPQVLGNLKYARSQVQGIGTDSRSNVIDGNWTSLPTMLKRLRAGNDHLVDSIGQSTVVWILAVSSVLFWSLLIVRTVGFRFQVWKPAIPIFLILTISLISVVLLKTSSQWKVQGIVAENRLDLRAGDGDQFPTLYSIETAQGQPVKVLFRRANWLQVETSKGHVGWTESKAIESIQQIF